MLDLGPGDWALLIAAALMVGLAKTALTGTGAVAAAVFALVLPARESTGALLPLLIAGDLVAIGLYRQHASWPVIRRLFPWVAVGVVVGAAFVARVDDSGMRVAIGVLLLSGMAMMEFLGTGAVFYLLVNLFKLPFSIGLGLVSLDAIKVDVALVPVMLLGAALGVLVIRGMNQAWFERIAIALVAVAAIPLLA